MSRDPWYRNPHSVKIIAGFNECSSAQNIFFEYHFRSYYRILSFGFIGANRNPAIGGGNQRTESLPLVDKSCFCKEGRLREILGFLGCLALPQVEIPSVQVLGQILAKNLRAVRKTAVSCLPGSKQFKESMAFRGCVLLNWVERPPDCCTFGRWRLFVEWSSDEMRRRRGRVYLGLRGKVYITRIERHGNGANGLGMSHMRTG
jgi:hypothetical protein